MLFSLTHHFLKICSDRPPCSMPGVANTTIGPGLSVYDRSNGCTTTTTIHLTFDTLHHTWSVVNHSQTDKDPRLANLCSEISCLWMQPTAEQEIITIHERGGIVICHLHLSLHMSVRLFSPLKRDIMCLERDINLHSLTKWAPVWVRGVCCVPE